MSYAKSRKTITGKGQGHRVKSQDRRNRNNTDSAGSGQWVCSRLPRDLETELSTDSKRTSWVRKVPHDLSSAHLRNEVAAAATAPASRVDLLKGTAGHFKGIFSSDAFKTPRLKVLLLINVDEKSETETRSNLTQIDS